LDQWWSSICSTDTIAIRSKCDGGEPLFDTFEGDPGERRSRPLGLYDDAKARWLLLVAKVENRTIQIISRKLIFGLLRRCVAFQHHYGGPWSILDEAIWSLTSPLVKRISDSKKFRLSPPKRLLQQYPPGNGHRHGRSACLKRVRPLRATRNAALSHQHCDALNTTEIDKRTGDHRPWGSPSTSHELQPPAPRSSLP